jgi:nitrite reductase (NADH) small subunit
MTASNAITAEPEVELWIQICAMDDIPSLGARVVSSRKGNIALFRTATDEVFAVHDQCPHKGGPLSQGIVHGRSVTCPLHAWKIDLTSGEALAPDRGCIRRFATRVENGQVYLRLEQGE